MASASTRATLAALVIEGQNAQRVRVPLERSTYRLGRAASNDLPFPTDNKLSREHLIFELSGEDWTVRDLGSRNGTAVNGSRISQSARLKNGDCVTAGSLSMRFVSAEDLLSDRRNTVVFVDDAVTEKVGLAVDLKTALAASVANRAHSAKDAHLQALIRAGRELVSRRPIAELFRTILDISVQAVSAARGVLLTFEKGELTVNADSGEGFAISSGVVKRVLADRSSLLVLDTALDQALVSRQSIISASVKSIMAVPLQTEESILGIIYVDSREQLQPFTADDLNLLTVMANIAATRIEQSRLLEIEQAEKILARDLEQASELQSSLLPGNPPDIPGFDLVGYNAACRKVGGDYYDFFPFSDGRIALLIADVAGKGMPAALLMCSLQARAQVLFEDGEHLSEKLERLNRAVKAYCPGNRFITFFVAVLDPKTGEITFCNAGHNSPMILRGNSSVETLDPTGLVLGIFSGTQYEQKTCRIEQGDILVLFSDGVTEACNPDTGEEFGEARLVTVIQQHRHETASSIVHAVVRELSGFTKNLPAADDITFVVASRMLPSQN